MLRIQRRRANACFDGASCMSQTFRIGIGLPALPVEYILFLRFLFSDCFICVHSMHLWQKKSFQASAFSSLETLRVAGLIDPSMLRGDRVNSRKKGARGSHAGRFACCVRHGLLLYGEYVFGL